MKNKSPAARFASGFLPRFDVHSPACQPSSGKKLQVDFEFDQPALIGPWQAVE